MQTRERVGAEVQEQEVEGQAWTRCDRCNGTGLVCAHVPVIGPDNCCVDFANAICPQCNGRGLTKPPLET